MDSLWNTTSMSMYELDQVLRFEPALPCCTLNGDSLCGKPATGGIGWYTGSHWYLQPICADCIAATARLYAVKVLDPSLTAKEEPKNEAT